MKTPTTRKSALLVSVDLDMWYHCRWATGGPKSIWPSIDAAIADCCAGDMTSLDHDFERAVDRIFELFAEHGVTATFFMLGTMARRYPRTVKAIQAAGHEVASHCMDHVDATRLSDRQLRAALVDSKNILEDLAGVAVTGCRFPNLVYGKREFEALIAAAYRYDSSVCFSRRLFGKFGHAGSTRNNPYRPDPGNPFAAGHSPFWEFPIPVFPGLRLPAGSGIATRILGLRWSMFALDRSLSHGDTVYYFHPYELCDGKPIASRSLNARLFLRGAGEGFRLTLARMLGYYRSRVDCISMREWISRKQGGSGIHDLTHD